VSRICPSRICPSRICTGIGENQFRKQGGWRENPVIGAALAGPCSLEGCFVECWSLMAKGRARPENVDRTKPNRTEPQATAALAMLPHPDALQGGRVDHFARPSVCSPLPAENTVCCCVLFTVGERSGTSALLFCVRCLHYASKPSKFRTNGRSRGARLRWRWVHRLEFR